MLLEHTVAVVIPAFNEETQIYDVLKTIPGFVDRIVVVNDCSTDSTRDIILRFMAEHNQNCGPIECNSTPALKSTYNRADRIANVINRKQSKKLIPSKIHNTSPLDDRIILIDNLQNGGVGAAISRGYIFCRGIRMDCTAVMAGDGQMDPAELESICSPVIKDKIDYVKGNRLIHRSAWLVIPKIRYLGNSVLSMLTKVASGYWRVSDTQSGYTAISLKALQALRLHDIYKGYGMPNDMLVKLNIAFCTIHEVEIKPIYNIGEKSKMNILKTMPKVSWLLTKSFFSRLWIKYLFKDFHPLFLLYNFSFLTLSISAALFVRLISEYFSNQQWSFSSLLLFSFLSISGIQFLLGAMWMDMQDNDRLYK